MPVHASEKLFSYTILDTEENFQGIVSNLFVSRARIEYATSFSIIQYGNLYTSIKTSQF